MPTELPLTNRDPKYFTMPLPPPPPCENTFAVLFSSYIEKKARKCSVLLELSFDTGNWNILSHKTLHLLVRIHQTLFWGRSLRQYSVCTTELYYITGGSARGQKVKPKTWRILTFADAISMTTGPKCPQNCH